MCLVIKPMHLQNYKRENQHYVLAHENNLNCLFLIEYVLCFSPPQIAFISLYFSFQVGVYQKDQTVCYSG